jgi:hypothetical protein
MPHPRLVVSVACVLMVACGSEPRAPKLPASVTVFPNLLLPPSAQFVSRSGSEETLQIRLFSAKKPDEIIRHYRDLLKGKGWRLVSDVKRPDGSVMLYAEQDGPPLWVRIWPTSDGVGTMVELSGAVVAKSTDSMGADHRRSKTSPKPSM